MTALGAWKDAPAHQPSFQFSAFHDAPMAHYVTSVGIILLLIKQMETTVLALRHLREYVTADVSAALLDAAINEGEARVADARRKLAP